MICQGILEFWGNYCVQAPLKQVLKRDQKAVMAKNLFHFLVMWGRRRRWTIRVTVTENVALSVCLFYVSRELSQIFCSAVKEVKTRSTSQDGETTTQQLYHFNDFELDQYYVDLRRRRDFSQCHRSPRNSWACWAGGKHSSRHSWAPRLELDRTWRCLNTQSKLFAKQSPRPQLGGRQTGNLRHLSWGYDVLGLILSFWHNILQSWDFYCLRY